MFLSLPVIKFIRFSFLLIFLSLSASLSSTSVADKAKRQSLCSWISILSWLSSLYYTKLHHLVLSSLSTVYSSSVSVSLSPWSFCYRHSVAFSFIFPVSLKFNILPLLRCLFLISTFSCYILCFHSYFTFSACYSHCLFCRSYRQRHLILSLLHFSLYSFNHLIFVMHSHLPSSLLHLLHHLLPLSLLSSM